MRWTLLIAAMAALLPTGESAWSQQKGGKWNMARQGPPTSATLDLTGYRLTFNDDFDRLDVTADGGKGPWFAPIHATFGPAKLVPPGPDGPFSVKDGMLTIRASSANGRWTSGTMQTVDSHGRGFAQQYGYFELRAKLPKGVATWPAFWLYTRANFTDPTAVRGEIDVLEQYGNDPDNIHTSLHLRPPRDQSRPPLHNQPWFTSKITPAPGITDDFHTYGAMVDPAWITFYYDRRQIARFPTLDEYKTPLYMLVTLAMRPERFGEARNPTDMLVDYVRVYARDPAPTQAGPGQAPSAGGPGLGAPRG